MVKVSRGRLHPKERHTSVNYGHSIETGGGRDSRFTLGITNLGRRDIRCVGGLDSHGAYKLCEIKRDTRSQLELVQERLIHYDATYIGAETM